VEQEIEPAVRSGCDSWAIRQNALETVEANRRPTIIQGIDLRSDEPCPVAAMETPCENICIVDQPSGLCRGCGRSLAEIERWTAYSDGERARIMDALPARLEAMTARGAKPVLAGRSG
jgi:predicted Fe-S protein YdhL (DUF1289 family)